MTRPIRPAPSTTRIAPTARAASPSRAAAGPALERTLTYRLHRLHKLTDQESHQAYLRQAGLSLSDGRCLATVGAFEPLSVKDLARLANLNKSQGSRAAQALVEQGLVRKQDRDDDGRGVVLTLTEAGRRSWRRTMALIDERNDRIFGCLDDGERRTLSELLDRLLAHNHRDR